jgi:hypothetical protein
MQALREKLAQHQDSPVLRLETIEAGSKGRPLGIHLALASLRVLEEYRPALGDSDRTAILAAVAALQSARALPAPTLTAIAAASGFARETTRRKIAHLVAAKMLCKDDGGASIDLGITEQPALIGGLRRHIIEVAKLINAFADYDIVSWQKAPPRSFHAPLPNRNFWGASRLGPRETTPVMIAARLRPSDAFSHDLLPSMTLELFASMHRVFAAYRRVAGSIDYVLLLLAVLIITTQHLTHRGVEDEFLDIRRMLPRERLGICNVSSLAAATGLPVETTRRKTLELIGRGTLQRDAGGNVQFTPGILQQPRIYDLVVEHASEVTALANRLVQLGALIPAPA